MKRLLYYYEGLSAMIEYSGNPGIDPDAELIQNFNAAMSDDMNTVSAVSSINLAFKRAREIMAGKKTPQKQTDVSRIIAAIQQVGAVLGLFKNAPAEEIHSLKIKLLPSLGITEPEIDAAILERKDARAAKDFARSDAVRDRLATKGIELRDSPSGTIWSIRFSGDDN